MNGLSSLSNLGLFGSVGGNAAASAGLGSIFSAPMTGAGGFLTGGGVTSSGLTSMSGGLLSGAGSILGGAGLGFGAGMLTNSLLGGKQMRSEEHTSEIQSLMRNSYAVFCLKKK